MTNKLDKAIAYYKGVWPDSEATHILWDMTDRCYFPAVVNIGLTQLIQSALVYVIFDYKIVCTREEFLERVVKLENNFEEVAPFREPVPSPTCQKFDEGKLRYGLIPPRPLAAIVTVLTFGAVKYAPNNWQKVPNAKERYTDALMRHIELWRSGETYDQESGEHHLAHAGCCILFLLWFELTNKEKK